MAIGKAPGEEYRVLYKTGGVFCKSLDYGFPTAGDAESVAVYLQYWVNAGGHVGCTGDEGRPGNIVVLDNTGLSDSPLPVCSQLFHVFRNGGYCPLPMAKYLLGMQGRSLDYFLARHQVSYLMAGRVKLVNMHEFHALYHTHAARKQLLDDMDDLQGRVSRLSDEQQRLSCLLPALHLVSGLVQNAVPDVRDGAILSGFINGMGYGELARNYAMTNERARQIVVEQLEKIGGYICELAALSSRSLELKARNLRLEQENAQLRAEAQYVNAGKLFRVVPDKRMRRWVDTLCRLSRMSLEEMKLSTRTVNVLQTLGVHDIFGIARLDIEEFARTRQSGTKTVHEITTFRNRYRLELLGDPACLSYVESIARELTETEIKKLGVPGFSMDNKGNVWVPPGQPVPTLELDEDGLPRTSFDGEAPYQVNFPEKEAPLSILVQEDTAGS